MHDPSLDSQVHHGREVGLHEHGQRSAVLFIDQRGRSEAAVVVLGESRFMEVFVGSVRGERMVEAEGRVADLFNGRLGESLGKEGRKARGE